MQDYAVAAALRQIAGGFNALARAVEDGDETKPSQERYRAALTEWGERGLTREEASHLLQSHGFAPQATGGWARGAWIETQDDGLRYLTQRSHDWLSQNTGGDDDD